MTELSTPAMAAASLYTGINMLILLVLSINVSRLRRASGIGVGDGGNLKLTLACRAHGNSAEWLPVGLGGLILAALLGAPALAVHALGAALTVGRLAFAVGILSSDGPSPGRMLGMGLTYLVYLLLGAGLIVHAAL